MSKYKQDTMEQEKFLTVAGNILYKALVEAPRTRAKNAYQAARDGKRVALMTVRMEDGSDLRFDVALDASEYRGKLNFGAFRASVTQLIGVLGEAVSQGKELPVFTEETRASVLFGLPAITLEQGEHNVLMMAADTRGAGTVLLKLMYMEPGQFIKNEQEPPQAG